MRLTVLLMLIASASTPMSAMAESGIATFYTHGRMADGKRYGANGPIFMARSASYRLGTWYRVTYHHHTMNISVRDHGPLASRHLDLSRGAFRALVGDMNKGVVHVTFKEIKK